MKDFILAIVICIFVVGVALLKEYDPFFFSFPWDAPVKMLLSNGVVVLTKNPKTLITDSFGHFQVDGGDSYFDYILLDEYEGKHCTLEEAIRRAREFYDKRKPNRFKWYGDAI